MAKNRNSFAKNQRDAEKRVKAQAKQARRDVRKQTRTSPESETPENAGNELPEAGPAPN